MAESTTSQSVAVSTHDVGAHGNYLNARKGLLSWVFTLDHKRIGLMYLASVLGFFLIAGIIALMIRVELFTPEGDLFDPLMYNKLFTLHGALMVFVVIIPSIPAALGNIFLPLQLGAKDVAFPRLNLASFHIYVLGSLFLIYSLINGAMDTGWTFYTPYSVKTGGAVISAVLGVFILGFSSILTGLNFIVTIHKMRAPGMTWARMPLFLWALYATAIIQVLATPVLAITVLLLAMERWFGVGIFDPAIGGDPILFQHFFWFYSHPAVYIMILPGFGIVSELITVHAQKRVFGYKAIALSSVAIAIISFLVWGHHLFTSGQSIIASAAFSFLTFAVAVPTSIKVFSWVATLYGGSIVVNTSMVYALVFLFLFTIGGLTGLFLGVLATDVHLHDTYFVVAHFHYVMMGGTLIAFIGGLFHWWPKFTGKMFNDKAGILSGILVFIGFNLTFFSQFILGSRGMPRRYHSYLPEFQTWHQVSTVGSLVLAVGLFVAAGTLIHSLRRGKKAPTNPWNAKSLEWTATTSPPVEHNFVEQPICTHGPYEFDGIDETLGKAHG